MPKKISDIAVSDIAVVDTPEIDGIDVVDNMFVFTASGVPALPAPVEPSQAYTSPFDDRTVMKPNGDIYFIEEITGEAIPKAEMDRLKVGDLCNDLAKLFGEKE